jgi:hypothetical protein
MSYTKFKVPYNTIEKVTLEKFNKNRWNKTETQKTYIKNHDEDSLVIEHFYWEFPDTKIRCDIELNAQGNGVTLLGIYVKNMDSWLYPFNYSSKDARKLLKLYEKRLKTGEWDKLPWEDENSILLKEDANKSDDKGFFDKLLK